MSHAILHTCNRTCGKVFEKLIEILLYCNTKDT